VNEKGSATGLWRTAPKHLRGARPASLRQAEARLLVRRPDTPEVEIKVDKQGFRIGRLASDVDLVIDEDTVSKLHASLTMDERGYFTLSDLGSKNGIEFEGRPVRRLNLLDGDAFRIGTTELVFRANLPPGQPPAPPPPVDQRASMFAEIPIPGPVPDPALRESIEVTAWNPEAAAAKALAGATIPDKFPPAGMDGAPGHTNPGAGGLIGPPSAPRGSDQGNDEDENIDDE
jgi:hypothetical protein